MRLHEIADKNFNLKKAIIEKKVCPTEVIDVTVWTYNAKINIEFGKAFKNIPIPKRTIIFFWDYSGNNCLVVREVKMNGGYISLEADKNLLHQMLLLHIESIRVGIAFQFEDRYFCGYCRNIEAKKEGLQVWDRSICKLDSIDKSAFVAYWTESGILSVRFRQEKKFDNDFYWVKLCGYFWEGGKLIAYLEAPLAVGEIKIEAYSMSTQAVCKDIIVVHERVGDTGLKIVWKMSIDLSNMPSNDSDGYRFLCKLEDHIFQIFLEEETAEDDLCKIHLKSGSELEVCVIKNIDGQFILKTGRIYPVMLSIVTAVYNTAPFLAEMINSVLSQKVEQLEKYRRDYCKDYYKNIFEFILIDDGSTDGSADILDDYARISDKIRVIHKENGGVSSARNLGIEAAKGKYINFADSDDKLSENFVEECLLFFEKNWDDVDVVTAPIIFFDKLKEEHWCNGKFKKGNRVINLQKEYKNVLMFVNASIFKTSKVKGNRLFDEKLKTAEDIQFIYSFFIREKPCLGVVSTCFYAYRRRSIGEESLIQRSKKDKNRYIEYFTEGMNYLISESTEKYGEIPRFVQYLMACDLQWRFIQDSEAKIAKSVLNESEFLYYKKSLQKIIALIDIDIIWMQEKIWREQKMFMSKWKYGTDPKRKYVQAEENVHYYYEHEYLTDAATNYLKIDFLKIDSHSMLYIEGTNYSFEQDGEIFIRINDEYVKTFVTQEADFNILALGEVAFYGRHFSLEYKLKDSLEEYRISIYEKFQGYLVKKKNIRYGVLLPLSTTFSNSYYIESGWCIRKEENIMLRRIKLTPEVFRDKDSLHSFLKYEQDYISQIKASSKYEKDEKNDAIELREKILQIIANYKKYSDQRIWLISDRVNVADDNGEALFLYLNQIKPEKVQIYFIINRDSIDFARLKEYGNVVGQGTTEHKILHCLAEYVISSQMDEYIQNPFYHENVTDMFRDLVFRPKFVFLQHGITKDNVSRWLSRLNKNLFGLVTSTKSEYASILEYPYLYSEKNIWLTGLPRYDRLYHNEQRKISIMPTWRSYHSQRDEHDKNRMVMKCGFTESDYFQFYNNLINNARLLDSAEQLGYQICFRPHPTVMKNLGDFHHEPRVIFYDETVPYRDIFAESNLCVTDYSSAVMDFAYLRKPVVYVQFDKQRFFSGEHIYEKGYFDYEKDGFGEVVYDMETLIDVIIKYMEEGCKIKSQYLHRINYFFRYNDRNNCERVYKKLLNREG